MKIIINSQNNILKTAAAGNPIILAVLTASQYRKYGQSWFSIMKAAINGLKKFNKRSTGLKQEKANEQLVMFVRNEITTQHKDLQ